MNKQWQRTETLLIYLLLILTSIFVLYPMVLILMSSLKTTPEFMGNPIGFPRSITFDNYWNAWEQANFGNFSVNSILITVASVIGTVVFGSMAAYGLCKKFRGSKVLFNYFLLGLMIPTQTTIITLFIFMKNLHLLSTYSGLVLVYVSHLLPLAIFIFIGFFQALPKEMEEAAEIDGCSDQGIFWRIILPVSRPVIATVIILTGLNVWNDFFLPLILMLDQGKLTLPVGLMRLRGEFSTNWPQFFAAMGMIMIPVVVLFMFMQKQFVKGLTSGSVKG